MTMPAARDVPVVLILFNRPRPTARVWAAIRRWQPTRLFLVADGPRRGHPDDVDRCRLARACVDRVDWPCEVRRIYAEHNLGCRWRVNTGLDEVFTHVDQAIILEDDCLVGNDFFRFCACLLDRYRDNPDIHAICASNYLPAPAQPLGSYYLSRYACSWGWATWRRAWTQADQSLSFWPGWRDGPDWPRYWPRPLERWYWRMLLDDCLAGRIDTWDIPWWANVWHRGGHVLVSHHTLVSNIGHGAEATHTRNPGHRLADRPLEALPELVHPDQLIVDPDWERRVFEVGFEGQRLGWPDGLWTLPRLWLGQRYRMLRSQCRLLSKRCAR